MEPENTTVETKVFKLADIPYTSESNYRLKIEVPPKVELIKILKTDEDLFRTNADATFSSGVLADVKHSVKMEIFTKREMNSLFTNMQTNRSIEKSVFTRVFVKINPTPDEKIDILKIEGAFSVSGEIEPIESLSKFNFYYEKPNHLASEIYRRYEISGNGCKWPDLATTINILIHVRKTTYSMIVNKSSISPKKQIIWNADPFFMSEFCSDVKVKIGNTIFPAHKFVLSARSEYFHRMFSTEMQESTEGVVEFTDVKEILVREMLSFLYTNQLENLKEHAKDLFVLADKYAITELSAYCENYLISTLSVENAIDFFDLSHCVGLKGRLFQASKDIILKNKEKFAPNLDTFKDFVMKYPELIFELLKQ